MDTRKATKLLRDGAVLMLTLSSQGATYSIDGRGTVPSKLAQALTTPQGELASQADLFLAPNEDGLFPGFSQTWKAC